MSSGFAVRRLFVIAVLLATLGAMDASASGPVELISRADPPSPPQAVGIAQDASISADGRYVAFTSTSPNLAAGQVEGNLGQDVFLWDRVSGTVTLVSHSGHVLMRTGNAPSIQPRISADGNWVVFLSEATDLVGEQIDSLGTGATADVFLWERITGDVFLVSHSNSALTATGNGNAMAPAISADGAYVSFESTATDLVIDQVDSNSLSDVFLYSRASGELTLVSHASGAATTAGSSWAGAPSISADGRYVAFLSQSTNLAAGQTDANSMNDVFVYDRVAGMSVLVSHASGSATTAGNGFCTRARISANGGWITYTCNSSDLVAGQADLNIQNVFLYSRGSGASALVSHASGSATSGGNGESGDPSISADGAWVAYHSAATDLVAGQADTNATFDVFLFDRLADTSALVSGASGSATVTADAASLRPVLSADGGRLAFVSPATNLLSNQSDTNGVDDVFVYTRSPADLRVASHQFGSIEPALPAVTGNGLSSGPVLDADGSEIAFTSLASDLVEEGDTNGGSDVFHYTWSGESVVPVSFSPAVSSATPASFSVMNSSSALSANGRYVTFFSGAGNLVAGTTDANGEEDGDVYLRDRVAGTTALVSRSAASATTTGNHHSQEASLSADGAYVVFESFASDVVPGLDPGPPFGDSDVFLFDRAAGTNILVSHAPGAPTQSAEGTSNQEAISADGAWIVFSNLAGIVVSGQTEGNTGKDLFLYSRAGDASVLVSRNSSSPTATGSGPSELAALSADGRYVAFLSKASNLVAGQTTNNSDYNVFLFDRDTGATTLVSHASSSATTTGNAGAPSAQPLYRPAISADGAWVAFTSRATDLVAGQTDANSGDDVFLWERATGTVTLVSRASASATTAGNEASDSPSISADGRYVAFHGDASNLAPGQADTNLAHDVFVYDRVTGSTALVSHASGSTTLAATGFSFEPVISANGLVIAFHSNATDLVPGVVDLAATADVFLYDRASGTIRLLSHAAGSIQVANAGSGSPQLSANGETVAFNSFASDLVADDYNFLVDVFVHTPAALDYYTLTPCRLLDTRTPQDGPALVSGVTEVFGVVGGACGIPLGAKALALNVTIVQPAGAGFLSLFPGDFLLLPATSTINFPGAGAIRANNAILPLGSSGSLLISPFVTGGGTVHVILDVVGYFGE